MIRVLLVLLGLLVWDAPPAHAQWSHEPPGTLYMDCNMSQVCPQIHDVYGSAFFTNPGGTGALSPPTVMESFVGVGSGTGNGQWDVNLPSGGTRDIYVSAYWRMQNVDISNGNNKLMFISNPSNSFIGLIGQGACKTMVYYQQERVNNTHVPNIVGMTYPIDGTGWFWPNQGANATVCWGEPFAQYEVYLHAATTNTSRDGIIRIWLRGNLILEVLNANIGTDDPTAPGNIYTSPGRFRYVAVNHAWDGNIFPSVRWSHFWDHWRISFPTCPSQGCGVTTGGGGTTPPPPPPPLPPNMPTNLRVQ